VFTVFYILLPKRAIVYLAQNASHLSTGCQNISRRLPGRGWGIPLPLWQWIRSLTYHISSVWKQLPVLVPFKYLKSGNWPYVYLVGQADASH